MPTHDPEKASRYAASLDDARSHGRWQEVPELARKVEKHAPNRKCLAATARVESEVASFAERRPSSASTTTSTPNLSQLIPPLLSTIEQEKDHEQDLFQANTCLAWIHWVIEEPGLAVMRLPKDLDSAVSRLSESSSPLSAWTQVCIVKSAYLKGFSLEKTATTIEAIAAYASVTPFLESLPSLENTSPQFRLWTERLLSRLCLLLDLSAPSATSSIDTLLILNTYRIWAKFWDSRSIQAAGPTSTPESSRARRLVWKAYYDTLSTILRQGLGYTPPAKRTSEENEWQEKNKLAAEADIKLQQRAELKRVESIYEGLLSNETRFPRANQSNGEIELWIEAVISNWRILCGPLWSDEELGEGGKGAVGRDVLDILYRAATKTFHSTQILRYLFIVHSSLAEFDLAFKAFGSYVEIITRGKDRAEKSGEEDVGIDDDDTALCTAAEAIRLLCRFGHRSEAEQAWDIGNTIEKWLTQHVPSATTDFNDDDNTDHVLPNVSSRTLSISYRALGMSRANWARFTFDASSRDRIREQAVKFFSKALDSKLENQNNIETLFCLGLVLAEKREIARAIKVVKHALSSSSELDSTSIKDVQAVEDVAFASPIKFARERKLISVWHLLALLLTARSDFNTASKSCDAAFEQFGDEKILFGGEEQTRYRSEHLNDLSKTSQTATGLVDQMEAFERESIVQVKMTQLAMMELMDGSNTAVEHSDELLALYARLFGDPESVEVKFVVPPTNLPPPKSAIGTIKGSILGRPQTAKKGVERKASRTRRASSVASQPSSMATRTANAAPTIQVTDEDANHASNGNDGEGGPHRSGSVRLRKKSQGSLRRKSNAETEPPLPDGTRGREQNETHSPSVSTSPPEEIVSPNGNGKSDSSSQPLRSIPHNISHTAQPSPIGHKEQPPHQDVRLPRHDTAPPEPRLPLLQERRHKISLLLDVWIFMSGLYIRAGMYEDAKGAIEEASKLVSALQTEVAQESSSIKAFCERGWGGGKSVEELWGDVWAAYGILSQAQDDPHGALRYYETSLQRYPDHRLAIVGLSNILLDIHAKNIPPEPIDPNNMESTSNPAFPGSKLSTESGKEKHVPGPSSDQAPTPEELHRVAARDRAHGLLSSVTKLGNGWDYCEAWFALARAYEESGEIEKAKEVLWWCVELEDTRPLREWRHIGVGGFVL